MQNQSNQENNLFDMTKEFYQKKLDLLKIYKNISVDRNIEFILGTSFFSIAGVFSYTNPVATMFASLLGTCSMLNATIYTNDLREKKQELEEIEKNTDKLEEAILNLQEKYPSLINLLQELSMEFYQYDSANKSFYQKKIIESLALLSLFTSCSAQLPNSDIFTLLEVTTIGATAYFSQRCLSYYIMAEKELEKIIIFDIAKKIPKIKKATKSQASYEKYGEIEEFPYDIEEINPKILSKIKNV